MSSVEGSDALARLHRGNAGHDRSKLMEEERKSLSYEGQCD